MWCAVITLFPEMFNAIQDHGITGRAFKRKISQLCCINPRDFAEGGYRRVDERPFGGGPGMVMMAEPLAKAIQHAKSLAYAAGCQSVPVIYMSPQGTTLDEQAVCAFSQYDGLVILCGRYEGVDERLIARYVDIECSIGDYVLSGGELAAMVLLDSVIRRLPDTMSDAQSAVQDSFVDGLLDCPQYTKPDEFEGLAVPAVLKSGHHLEIEKWRFLQKYRRTQLRRPDLMGEVHLNPQQIEWLKQIDKTD